MSPSLPRRLVVSDIHGCYKTFCNLLYEVMKVTLDDELFLLGDFIDRGPDSKAVIDEIFELRKKGFKIRTLRGNHEQLLLDSLTDNERKEVWLRNGGLDTLRSFNIRQLGDIPKLYMDFFRSLEFCVELDDFILVHAGLNTFAEDPFADHYSMMWLRNFSILPEKTNNRVVVHGHTPSNETKIRNSIAGAHQNYQIVIDNGCVYGLGPGIGSLCCLELNSLELTFVNNRE